MRVVLQPISSETQSDFKRWTLLRVLSLEAHGVDSKAFSRIDRAKRIRKEIPQPVTVEDVALLSAAAGFEAEAYKNISAIPDVLNYFYKELLTLREHL